MEGHAVPADALLVLLDGRRLSPAQRRIAQYLLDHMPDSAFLSSVVLARRAGVSQPSVTRFAAALGFSGYPAFRDALRTIALDAPGAPTLAGATGLHLTGTGGRPGPRGPAAGRDDAGHPMQAAVADEIANLQALHELLADPRVVTGLARELVTSVPLAVLGLRISAPLAEYFSFAARRIHPDVRCLTFGGSVVFDALLHVSEAGGKWLVAFALPRYPAETVQALRFARRLGMRTAVISDVRFVPFAGDADVLLPAAVGTRLLFDSHAAPAVLAGVIVQAMADADPERAQERLREHEQLSAGQGVFLDR
ncbi:MAG TPA: MurR/RpiR family transcriptional regulator [Streptosporangiaceae bacterium]|jgi:DNA-binding MurR/RpiR family transcriptional regulator